MAYTISIKQAMDRLLPQLERRMWLINKKRLTEEEKQELDKLEERLF